MGIMINGVWHPQPDQIQQTKNQEAFHDWITKDGSSGFKAEPDRYHLYISLACPWVCRTLIFRKLKGLGDIISLSIVDPIMGENGWAFSSYPGCIPDNINGCAYLHEIYSKAKPDFTGRVSVPVLWDKKNKGIVSNESSEIIRMFNSAFDDLLDSCLDFYPENLRSQIDDINEKVFSNINIGVYKCGFATSQQDYDIAFDHLFLQLDKIENLLRSQRYLVGDQITEADWRLFSTLIRFDPVYHTHFKCNLRQIKDYPQLNNYLRELYQYLGIAETVDFDHIKRHYYLSHRHLNPSGIIPKGPEMNLTVPHDRTRFSSQDESYPEPF
jgi:putative glutathione S-transferase